MSVIHYKTDMNTYVGINSNIMNIIGKRFIYGLWISNTPVESFSLNYPLYDFFIYDSNTDTIIYTHSKQQAYSTIKRKIDKFLVTGII